ncbi:hypothetical protein SAMN05216389_105119 [Oceanobacillus limi]|uniref:Uncharacterized protein n=1 Tax=Oceanobacillus limi TaxID=930131 RepID=A0A1I0BP27_9BACI|nr:hypothetical protein [Oceanobacillus limi]SET08820.1 hypothetical protein SAMN05216389_105119 [Oceanobacillus limi]
MNFRKLLPKSRLSKAVFISILVCIIIGGSFNVVVAKQDIQSLLNNWFNQQKTESITEIEQAITDEQGKQTERLRKEIQFEIERVRNEINEFTMKEKEKRVLALQSYADKLIANFEPSEPGDKKAIESQLDQIMLEAQRKMDHVSEKNQSNNHVGEDPKDSDNPEEDQYNSEEVADKPEGGQNDSEEESGNSNNDQSNSEEQSQSKSEEQQSDQQENDQNDSEQQSNEGISNDS